MSCISQSLTVSYVSSF